MEVSQMLQEERDALTEYHALAELQMNGHLTPAQQVRLREVEATLDRIEAEEPQTRAALARLAEAVERADALLAEVRASPEK